MPPLTHWAQAHPATLKLLSDLYNAGIPSALISGMVAVAYGVREQTNDVDLFTPPSYFWRIPPLLPDHLVTLNKRVRMHDRLGKPVEFTSNEITVWLDGTVIQIVQPISLITIEGYKYDMSHTELVTSHLQKIFVLGRPVLVTHVFDTVAMKGLFQRGRGKSDISDATGLAPFCFTTDPYLKARAKEIGYRDREYRFMSSLGLRFYESREHARTRAGHDYAALPALDL